MSITLEQLSAKMRQGEQVPLRQTAQIVLTLSIPSILQQIVVTRKLADLTVPVQIDPAVAHGDPP